MKKLVILEGPFEENSFS